MHNRRLFEVNMKKLIIGSLLGMSVSALFAFRYQATSFGKSSAEAAQVNGLYIFTDCKPLADYQSLGKVDISFFMWDTQYESVRNNLVRRAKKKYPEAEGVIIKPSRRGVDIAEVIRFKQ